MADLVGLIASVLQLVDVVTKTRNYIQDFRNAPHEQKELVLEIQNLGPLIRKLDKRISDDEAHGSDTIIRNFKDPLRQLETMLEQLAKKLDSDGIKKFSGRVTWPLWGKEDVNETLGAIERFKSSLTASLGMEIFNSTQDISSSLFDVAREQRADHGYIIRSLHQSAQDQRAHHVDTMSVLQNAAEDQRLGTAYLSKSVRDILANQEQHYNPAEHRQIIEWASPLNFFPRQADILSNRQPGTGEWLLQDGMFKRWEAGEIRALWCRGIPGAGKTVLASIVVNDLRENLANETTGVAAVYLDHKETEAHSPTNLLAAIWQQLALGKPVSSLVHVLYNKHREQSTRPSLQEIHSVLHAAVLDCSSVYIVVDALDEYPEEHRNTLLRYLWKLGSAAKLMFTSRPHIGIDHIVPNVETLDVRASEEDIRRYLEGQILKSSRLSRHVNKPSSGLREAIEDKIVKRSDGMFLLAKLHIDSLMTKQNAAAVKDALLRLPSDLDGTYNDIVNRINRQSDNDRDLAWRTLSWVLNAKKPLRPSQFREALALYPSATQLDPDRLTDLDIILSVCAGLVAVDEVSNQVRVIHYTTQIYFQSPNVHASLFPHAQSEITLTCMAYMRLTFEAFSHRLKQPLLLFTHNEFLHYAVEYCLVHAHGEPETHIQQSILYFLGDCSIWWRLWNWKHGGRQSAPDKLHIAHAFDLEVICARIIKQNEAGRLLQEAIVQGATDDVRILVEEDISVESEDRALETAVVHGYDKIFGLLLAHCPSDRKTKGRFGAALYQASCRGNAHSVESLITHGADVNAEGGDYGTALQMASQIGHKSIVKLLIDYGADVHVQCGRYGTAVQIGVQQGQEEIIQLLLEHGADVNAARDLLHIAVCQGHEGIVRLLIEHRANINTFVGPHGSVLCAASSLGHKAIVQLLLDHGADVNAEGGENGNAVQVGVQQGREEVVQLLLEHGANVNVARDLLQVAVCQGHEEIVRLLIEHGANINTSVGPHGSALCAASSLGHKAIVQLLLDHGADVNAEGGENGNAVQVGVQQGQEEIVQLLLEHGADVNAARDLLQVAVFQGHEGIVRLLIEHGTNINTSVGPHGSALCAASSLGHKAIVRLLLDLGANVNAEGGKDGSAVQVGVQQGQEEIVQLLLEHGADANAARDLLQVAVCQGHEGIVRLLVEHGTNVNTSVGPHGSALCTASSLGHKAIVQLLLDHGADVNAEGGIYGSAVQVGMQQGREEIVQLLFEHGADVNARDLNDLLQVAVCRGYGGIVQLLIEHGANVNTSAVGPHSSALCAASSLGHKAIVQLLLDLGADVNAEGGKDGSAVQVGVQQGREEIVQLLLEHGANVNARDLNNLLHIAACQGHEGIVRLLIEHGANVNTSAVGPHGNALCAASRFGHKAVVQLLLDLGADVNAKGGQFSTALQAALWNGEEDTAQLLIQHGANVNTPGLRNGTALWVASRLGYETIVQQLLDLGADVNARDKKYGSAVQGAFDNGHQSIFKLLIEHGAEFNPMGIFSL